MPLLQTFDPPLLGMQGFLYNDDNADYGEVGVEDDNGNNNTTDRRGI